MVRRLKKDDRLDTYGGYVYDSGDVKPSTDNVRGFNHLTYKLDFPKFSRYFIKDTDPHPPGDTTKKSGISFNFR